MSMENRFQELIAAHLERRRPLERGTNEASWELALTSNAEWEAKSMRLETELKMLFADKDVYEELIAIRDSGEVVDAELARQLELLILQFGKNLQARRKPGFFLQAGRLAGPNPG